MVSTLGKKLAPSIPRFFSEVVLATTETKGDQKSYYWSTNEANTILKDRSLPVGGKHYGNPLAPEVLGQQLRSIIDAIGLECERVDGDVLIRGAALN
jgi:hypothetical protein